ncbi:hypothetical protein I551_4147 [Mycobacterium ulcerans str. Harvey]|uniref:Uncharacterized protein n=1 Tax=Mycobacterium ulcerans str. Harvey TaxID=1299332 RepID=A0ABN0QXH1_MYCUL|nr:hypothetical protein I551_4147 [Mycobacterium ulcerans str. Harvey]
MFLRAPGTAEMPTPAAATNTNKHRRGRGRTPQPPSDDGVLTNGV